MKRTFFSVCCAIALMSGAGLSWSQDIAVTAYSLNAGGAPVTPQALAQPVEIPSRAPQALASSSPLSGSLSGAMPISTQQNLPVVSQQALIAETGGVDTPAAPVADAPAPTAPQAAPMGTKVMDGGRVVLPSDAPPIPTVYATQNTVAPIVDAEQQAAMPAPEAPVSAPMTSVSVPEGDMTAPGGPVVDACAGARSEAGDHDPASYAASMNQKMALLEAEKEELRRQLAAAQPGDYKPISQCVAQDNRIAELEAQVNFLQEQNASLKKSQDEVMAAAAAAAAQAAEGEAAGGALSTPELPPLARPDLPQADASADAR